MSHLPQRETTLADIDPPLGYLSYMPRGRYCLLAIWGYSNLSRTRDVVCVFSLLDAETGNEVERSTPVSRRLAPERAAELRERVKMLNDLDAL